MKSKIVLAVILTLLLPYVVTLAWTGSVEGKEKKAELASGKKIILDRGGSESSIDVEEYLPGVVAEQIPVDYGQEALRAQAVIARTYIYKKMSGLEEIRESELNLSYLDARQLQDLWGSGDFVNYYDKVEQAVSSTKGMTITYDGAYIDPLFHGASAGRTRSGDQGHPYLQPVDSARDVEADGYLSIRTWTKGEFAEQLNKMAGVTPISEDQIPQTIQIIEKDDSGYVGQIQIGTAVYTGEQVQTALGLASPAFTLEEYEGGVRAVCSGIGHGYGLSQYGAQQKAQDGWKAEDILAFFYKNIVLISE